MQSGLINLWKRSTADPERQRNLERKKTAMNRIAILPTVETSINALMTAVTPQRVGTVKKQFESAIADRIEYQSRPENCFNGAPSKDIKTLDLLKHESVYRMFAVLGVAPEFLVNSVAYTPEEYEAKSKIPSEAKTKNLKQLKKFAETARFMWTGDKLERVVISGVACLIVASQYETVIDRSTCERFLSSIPLSHVSEGLAEAVAHYRATHMTGGAQTQTSQITLFLANLKAAKVVRNGRNKDFMLDLDSPLIESFAQRLGLTAQLEKGRAYRASIESQSTESVSE